MLSTTVYALGHYTWIILFALRPVNNGFTGMGYTMLFCNACILCSLRMTVREKYGISGSPATDFLVSAFAFPQVLLQIVLQLGTKTEIKKKKKKKKKGGKKKKKKKKKKK